MKVMRLLALLLLIAPLRAELREVVLHFRPSDCASCTLSLPERFQRIRGVEEVKLDSAANTLRLTLTGGNRVRLSRLHEALEQDGTKRTKTVLSGSGECARQDEVWTFRPHAADSAYAIQPEAPPAAGACVLSGVPLR